MTQDKDNVEETENKAEEAEIEDSELLEFEFNEEGEEDLKKTLKKFRADLKACQKEKEEYLVGWQKERADFANYKKQEDARKSIFTGAIREKILNRFLTVMDSFNLAFANKESWEKVDKNWRLGVEYIYNQLNSIFEEYGVKAIGQVGEDFDPNKHSSLDIILTDQIEKDHKISEVVQKGYQLGDTILRPANVKVWKYKD
jgi:molecular chaperone GrpE